MMPSRRISNNSRNNGDDYQEEQKTPEWQIKDDIKSYVLKLRNRYFKDLEHIQPDNIVYTAFSKKRSSVKASVRPIKGVWKLFAPYAYILSIHLESWETMTEPERLYVIYHELLHIPEEGFEPTSKEFQRLIKHDLQDFKSLVYEFGVYLEKIDNIIDDPDSKSPDVEEDDDEEDDDEDDTDKKPVVKEKVKAKVQENDDNEEEDDDEEEDED